MEEGEGGVEGIEGDHEAADAFEEEEIGGLIEERKCVGEGRPGDGLLVELAGDGWGEGVLEADGVDDVQGLTAIGKVCEGEGIVRDEAFAGGLAAGGEGFAGAQARGRGLVPDGGGDGAGDNGFADVGIGGGDKEAWAGKTRKRRVEVGRGHRRKRDQRPSRRRRPKKSASCGMDLTRWVTDWTS